MKHLAVLALPLCLAACAPLPLQDAPHMYGRVVSAADGTPVSGASVYYEARPGKVVLSGKDGGFEFPAVNGLHIVAVWGSDRASLVPLVIEAPGYLRSIKGIPVDARDPYFTVISIAPAPQAQSQ